MNSTTRSLLWIAILTVAVGVGGQFTSVSAKPQANGMNANAAATAPADNGFYLHAKHVKEVGLDCNTCHVPTKEGAVTLQRPGHEQCTTCHQDAFDKVDNQKICLQCHNTFPPTGADTLYPFPRYKKQRPILIDFSHAKHVDPHQRVDAKTGMRADCTHCHQMDTKGAYHSSHEACASCHSKSGMKPQLSATSSSADCQGCHNPMAIENPSLNAAMKPIPSYVVSGEYKDIKFSHQTHFAHNGQFNMNCTSCHKDVSQSHSLAAIDLPKMSDCGTCHGQQLASSKRMDNCGTCHVNKETGVALASYSKWLKPAFHDESFRMRHNVAAGAEGATCYMCHTALSPSSTGQQRCDTCHMTMKPQSHTVRWRDDVHGKFAAINRDQCATCHTADTCERCHNETPRSHQPLSYFKAGAHARLAMLNERSCMTCHTYENTCAQCHARTLR